MPHDRGMKPTQTQVRACYVPSPTGYLHVGGIRTALFTWLSCGKHGGALVVRVEDTDILRDIEGSDQKRLDDLTWLCIEPDEGPNSGGPFGPYRESERRDRYEAAKTELLASGDAYYCSDTPEEIEKLRKEAVARRGERAAADAFRLAQAVTSLSFVRYRSRP